MKLRFLILCCLIPLLSACDRLAFPDPAKEAEHKDAEGKAIGSACRHAGRALEDCFALNPKAEKASIFAGWKDMNDYMAQNKIDTVKPEFLPSTLTAAKPGEKTETSAPEDGEEEAATETSGPKAKPGKKAKADKTDHADE